MKMSNWLKRKLGTIFEDSTHSDQEGQTTNDISTSEKELEFYSLAPNSDAAGMEPYNTAIDYALSTESVRNIALSGTYGSGKSSIMKSYEKAHSKKRFLYISLAHFSEKLPGTKGQAPHADSENEKQGEAVDQGNVRNAGGAESTTSPDRNISNLLEGKILNQLLHQIDPDKIRESNFRIKREVANSKRIGSIMAFALLFLLCLYQIYFELWKSVVDEIQTPILSWLEFSVHPSFRVIGLLFAVVIAGGLVFGLGKKHNFHNIFRKVDVNGLVGIEVFETENDSYFDKYLNEVLYLFDHAQVDAIIFEDLDRYDVTLIFEKLREINELIYQKRRHRQQKEEKKKEKWWRSFCKVFPSPKRDDFEPLRFFYLVRDDVFLGADRTKFFDFIIPVVPYIDNNNSGEMFTEQMKKLDCWDAKITTAFLQEVSFHLSDMRLINNIINEYKIYSRGLAGSQLSVDSQCQLAMVIYKNLFPEDFSLLQQGRGYVFQLFQQKSYFISHKKDQYKEQIDDLKKQLQSAEDEALLDISELNALFFPMGNGLVQVDGDPLPEEMLRREIVEKIMGAKKGRVSLLLPGYMNNVRKLDIEQLTTAMENNEEYQQRKKAIENKQATARADLETQIHEIEMKQAHLLAMNLKELLKVAEGEQVWNIKLPSYERPGYVREITQSVWFELLKYLLSNGYINETYPAYLSYFYEGSLSPQDKDYLMALERGDDPQFERQLSNCAEILRRMDPAKLTLPASYNYSLLEYILAHEETARLTDWFQYMEAVPESVRFLTGFWGTEKELARFISAVNRYQPSWFRTWISQGVLVGDQPRKYAVDTIHFSETTDLTALNEDDWLTELISSDPGFLSAEGLTQEEILSSFFALHAHFHEIQKEGADAALLETVYQNDYYDLNESNLKLFMGKYFGGLSEEEVESRSFSYLYGNPEQPLSKRVQGQIADYFAILLSLEGRRFSDDKNAVIELLNHTQLLPQDKRTYIRRMDTVIENLRDIEDEALWGSLLETDRIQYTWQNIADYYNAFSGDNGELPGELTRLLGNSPSSLRLKYAMIEKRIGSEKAVGLCYAMAQNETWPEEKYRQLLRSTEFFYKDCEADNRTFPESRLRVLFTQKIIQMTLGNVEYIRKKYPGQLSDFVLPPQMKSFLALCRDGSIELTVEEMVSILSNTRLNDTDALELLEIWKKPLPVVAKGYHVVVKVRIVEKWLDPGDIPNLLTSFTREHSDVRNAFSQYCKSHANLIYEAAIQANFIPTEIYADCLDYLSESELLEMRPLLDNKAFEEVCTSNKSPKFENTPANRKILSYFQDHGWISSYTEVDGYLRAFGKRK